ncbi:hypothetical protein V6N13_051155 [Hibiscus sabdariffa]
METRLLLIILRERSLGKAREIKTIKNKGKERRSSRVRRSDQKGEYVFGTIDFPRTVCKIFVLFNFRIQQVKAS